MFNQSQMKAYRNEIPSDHLKRQVMQEYKQQQQKKRDSFGPAASFRGMKVGLAIAACFAFVLVGGNYTWNSFMSPGLIYEGHVVQTEKEAVGLSIASALDNEIAARGLVPGIWLSVEEETYIKVSSGAILDEQLKYKILDAAHNSYRVQKEESFFWMIDTNDSEMELTVRTKGKDKIYQLLYDANDGQWYLKKL